VAKRRGNTQTGANHAHYFYPAVAGLMGLAFVAGFGLRQSAPPRVTLQPATRIAQANSVAHLAHSPAGGAILRTAANALGEAPPENAARARRTFDTVYNLVRQYYVDRLPGDRKMAYGAARAMVQSLNDPQCYFLEPEQFALLESEAQGRYPGVGVSFFVRPRKQDGYTEHKIVVISAVPGSPAARAGLKPGDVITHVDDRWVLGYDPFLAANRLADRLDKPGATDADEAAYRKEYEAATKRRAGGMNLFAAQMVLRGDANTIKSLKLAPESRKLTVERPGSPAPLVLEMESKATLAPPVSAKTLPSGEGYVRVTAFTNRTGAEFREAIKTLPPSAPLVLDLRGNAGGVLESALEVEALLTPKGTEGAFAQQVIAGGKPVPVAARAPAGAKRSVVVLVDGGTASVSEALAASLADKGVATLVGGKTFGEATVQAAYTLPDGAAFVISTGRLLSPERRTEWAGTGLTPSVSLAAGLTEEQTLARAADVARNVPRVAAKKPGAK
jgi:carboxyl-terminal processing protease